LACEEKDGKTVVTSHLVGNFPGSPVDLRFLFKLEADKIASLEIIPQALENKNTLGSKLSLPLVG
jgi:hypothetical protein